MAAGKIESAATVRAGAGEFWAEIGAALREADLWVPGRMKAIIGPMWSEAIARRQGYEAFQRASPETVFGPRLAAPDINVRGAEVRAVQPEYLARFDLQFTDPAGEVVTKTVSMRDVWRPGMTVGDIYEAVREAAEGLSMDYGQGLVGFSNVRPVII